MEVVGDLREEFHDLIVSEVIASDVDDHFF